MAAAEVESLSEQELMVAREQVGDELRLYRQDFFDFREQMAREPSESRKQSLREFHRLNQSLREELVEEHQALSSEISKRGAKPNRDIHLERRQQLLQEKRGELTPVELRGAELAMEYRMLRQQLQEFPKEEAQALRRQWRQAHGEEIDTLRAARAKELAAQRTPGQRQRLKRQKTSRRRLIEQLRLTPSEERKTLIRQWRERNSQSPASNIIR